MKTEETDMDEIWVPLYSPIRHRHNQEGRDLNTDRRKKFKSYKFYYMF
jgi:hypothetical protein